MNELHLEMASTIRGAAHDIGKLRAIIKALHSVENPADIIAAVDYLHQGGVSVFVLVRQAFSLPEEWETAQYLVPILGYVRNVEVSDLLSLLQAMNDCPALITQPIADEFRSIFSRFPAMPIAIGDAIVAGAVGSDVGTRVWAVAFGSGLSLEAIEYAISIAQVQPNGARASAHIVHGIQRLHAGVGERITACASILFNSIEELASTSPHEVVACQAACVLAHYYDNAFQFVCRRLESGNAFDRKVIANWLASLTEVEIGPGRNPVQLFVNRLLALCKNDIELRPYAERVVISYLGKPNLTLVGVDALLQFADRNNDFDLVKVFPSIGSLYAFSQEALNRLVTCWALEDSYALLPLQSLLIACTSHGRPIGIDDSVFVVESDERKLRTVRRIIALSANGTLLCSLVESLAENERLQPAGLQLAIFALNFSIREYPAATEAFLRARIAALTGDGDALVFYRKSLEHHLQWREVLSSLPHVKELIPKESSRVALHNAHARINRQIAEQAHSKSVFASFAKKIHVKQGRMVASHSDSQSPQMTKMTIHKATIEVPNSETMDPVGMALLRVRNSR